MCKICDSALLKRQRKNRTQGFTLIEALVAMFIFAWIGLAAYQILDQIVLAQETTQKHSKQLARFQRVSWQLARDFRQMSLRPIVDENEDDLSFLETEGEDYLLEFTRGGWNNPLQWPRSDLQRVAYNIGLHPEVDDAESEFHDDEKLYLLRYYWQVLDRVVDSEPNIQAVLPDVIDFRARYWDKAGKDWSDTPLSTNELPQAVEVSIVLETEDVLSYIFRVL